MRPFLLRIVYFDLLLLALPLGDAQGAGNVAGDVQASTAHVEQTVHSHDQADVSHEIGRASCRERVLTSV